MSHNVCCVEFEGKKYRLPRFSVGEIVGYRGCKCIVVGASTVCGVVTYQLIRSGTVLEVTVPEYQLLSVGNVSSNKDVSYCGFRVGDTVVDTDSVLCLVSTVQGFDYKRRLVKIKVNNHKWSYLVPPADLKFINPVTLKMSKERKVLDEE